MNIKERILFLHLFGLATVLNLMSVKVALGQAVQNIKLDVTVSNQVVGNIEMSVGVIESGSQKGREGIVGKFSVKNQPSLIDLAKSFQAKVDHFNWFQVAEIQPPIPGLENPFIDPPSGSLGRQTTDFLPWFWDEQQTSGMKPSNQLSSNILNSGKELQFFDSPFDILPDTKFTFNTFLIGDFGNKTYDTLASFSWSAQMDQNQLTKITSLRGCLKSI